MVASDNSKGEEELGLLEEPNSDVLSERHLRTSRAIQEGASSRLVVSLCACFIIGLSLGLAPTAIKSFQTCPSTSRSLPEIRSGADPVTGAPNSWFHGNCGDSHLTARARGCHFNKALHAWLPPACFDQDDAADEITMYETRSFPWFDNDLNHLDLDDALSGHRKWVVTNMDWHVAHCTYVWQRLHRALLHGTQIDSYTADYAHTSHCRDMVGLIRNESTLQEPTTVWAKFPTCG